MAIMKRKRRLAYHGRLELEWNLSGMSLFPGQALLFCGRLAEVISVGSSHGPAVVEVTDEGNITHSYTVPNRHELQPLTKEGECVLDAMKRATAAPKTVSAQLRRLAELWLAAPRVGDMFFVRSGYYVELTEIWNTGVIIGINHEPVGGRSFAKQHQVSWDNARQLRKFLAIGTRPVYGAAAYATARPDYIDHPHLHRRRGSSPLDPGSRIVQRKHS
jgi:hypothetical protein